MANKKIASNQTANDRKLTITTRRWVWVHYGVNPILFMVVLSMVLLMLARLGLTVWHWDKVPTNGLLPIIVGGLRVDFASVCALFVVPMLVVLLVSLVPRLKLPRWLMRVLSVYCALAVAFLVMNEGATPGFILEYGVRPNHIYVQYLIYPKEVLPMLWQGHKLELIVGLLLTGLALVLSYRVSMWAFGGAKSSQQNASIRYSSVSSSSAYRSGSLLYTLCLLLLTIVVVPLGIRSSLGHRPLNPSTVAFCDNPLVNSLPTNSSYNAVYALAHLNDTHIGADLIYQRIDADQALLVLPEFSTRTVSANHYSTDPKACSLNQRVVPASELFATSPVPTGMSVLHQQAGGRGTPRNLVIILEESLGDTFSASQGGWPLTPNIDQLRQQGWYFENMFAAGHRSIRGIEAVTASLPPSPLQSIVDLPFGREPYATIFEVLNKYGYYTSFIYGGESHFDNMRNYFYTNGMNQVIEQKDYDHPNFVATWGVSDEDLFARANEEFKRHYAQGTPFCSVVFSSSFHDPFDIPEGKVSISAEDMAQIKAMTPDEYETREPRLLAAKYADYAVGQFFKQAVQEDYFKDTVFLVIADHESRVHGADNFPLNKFTIPAVILAPNVGPYIDQRVVSQIDMGMTLLSLLGMKGELPNVGQNLLRPDIIERAPMQFNNIFGFYDGPSNSFVQLMPQREPTIFTVQNHKTIVNPHPATTPQEQALVERAIKVENLGPAIYENELMPTSCATLQLPEARQAAAAAK